MVSRRKYISMTLMMLVLLFMFQFTQVIKDMDNEYNINEFAFSQNLPKEENVWKSNITDETDVQNSILEESQQYVVYLGDLQGQIGNVVSQWCLYTKRTVKEIAQIEDVLKISEVEVLLIDAEALDAGRDINILLSLADRGMSMIFCNLPEASVIAASEKWRSLLGIQSVEMQQVTVKGIKLFSGFLLGGETIYRIEEEEDAERQDLDLTMPYYVASGTTKTYMLGMLDDTKIKNEYLPAIIWRNSYKDARIFLVNGDYMYDNTGIGILTAMMAEMHTYDLYPIVNAQNLSIANFPGFAEENSEELMRLYSRTASDIYRDVFWPGIAATTRKNLLKETLFYMPQSQYLDENEPLDTDYVFYLKELNEQGAEAGISLNNRSDVSMEEKLTADDLFYKEANDGYVFTAGYVENTAELEEIKEKGLLGNESLQSLHTIVKGYEQERPIFEFLTDAITVQSTTSDGFAYTFSQDLRMRSLQTALGYSNILLDMYELTWPQDLKDNWENKYDVFSRNINTFWRPFKIFDETTMSESDMRIRNMLAVDFQHSYENNVISLQVKNLQDEVWFILKTNNMEVESVTGANYEKIEDDAYLLHIAHPQVYIYLKEEDVPYYYIP